MASANPYDVLTREEMEQAESASMSMEKMKISQTKFAKEAFTFLLRNAQLWIENPKDCFTEETDPDNSVVFTTSVGKTIITIGYLLRVEYRKEFRRMSSKLNDPSKFESFIKNFPIPQNNMYFFHFLSWVAFAFEMAVLCSKEDYKYFAIGEACIANYPDIKYFQSRGGWYHLLECSKCIAAIYDTVEPVISRELPQNDIVPLIIAIENFEIENEHNSASSLVTPKFLHLRQMKNMLSKKYDVIPTSDQQSIIPGYKVIRKKFQLKTTLKDSRGSSKEPIFDASNPNETDDLIDLTSQMNKAIISGHENSSDSSGAAFSSSITWETDYSKCVFVIRDRFLNKRKKKLKDPEYKRYIQTVTPSDEIERLNMNINKILNENIENNTYLTLEDNMHAFFPPGRSINEEDTLLLLNNSSEEEGDWDEKSLEVIKRYWSEWQERTLSESQIAKESKCINKIPSDLLECVPLKKTGSMPKEIFTETSLEQMSELLENSKSEWTESSKIPFEQQLSVSTSVCDPNQNIDLLIGSASHAEETISELAEIGDSSRTVFTSSTGGEMEHSKSIFVIRDRYLNKRKAYLKDPNYKRRLPYTPVDEMGRLDVDQILDENIQNESYLSLNDGMYIICSPGRNIYKDTQFQLLGNSSEEEDDWDDKSCKLFHQKVCAILQDRMRSESLEAEKPKRVAEILSDLLECEPSESVESVPK